MNDLGLAEFGRKLGRELEGRLSAVEQSASPGQRALCLRSAREFVNKVQARLGTSKGSMRCSSDWLLAPILTLFLELLTAVASAMLALLVTMTVAVTTATVATTATFRLQRQLRLRRSQHRR